MSMLLTTGFASLNPTSTAMVAANVPIGKASHIIKGPVLDVAVNMRAGSGTYGKWFGVEFTNEKKKQFYIPKGFANGPLVLFNVAKYCYKVMDFYISATRAA